MSRRAGFDPFPLRRIQCASGPLGSRPPGFSVSSRPATRMVGCRAGTTLAVMRGPRPKTPTDLPALARTGGPTASRSLATPLRPTH